MARRAKTLDEAIEFLDPDALTRGSELDDWYVPATIPEGSQFLPPLAMLRARLLRATPNDRFFLSGHIGSGKTTELRRMLAETRMRQRFFIVDFELAREEREILSSHHLLLLIAAEIYRRATEHQLLSDDGSQWKAVLQRIDARLFGPTGLVIKDGKVAAEFDLVFTKLKTELALQDSRRREFRAFAESDRTVLVDLINALVNDVRRCLVARKTEHRDLLVVIDDLDKIHKSDQLLELFDTNRSLLLAPHVPLLMTIPASVTFGGQATELGSQIAHLRPVQVLKKTTATDPMDAEDSQGTHYLQQVLAARVAEGLFEPRVVRTAAVYSGGVLRDFFRMLRDGAILANDVFQRPAVEWELFSGVLTEARNTKARDLYPDEREALKTIHTTHLLTNESQLAFMRDSTVLEYNHQGIWWEVNPVLWELLTTSP